MVSEKSAMVWETSITPIPHFLNSLTALSSWSSPAPLPPYFGSSLCTSSNTSRSTLSPGYSLGLGGEDGLDDVGDEDVKVPRLEALDDEDGDLPPRLLPYQLLHVYLLPWVGDQLDHTREAAGIRGLREPELGVVGEHALSSVHFLRKPVHWAVGSKTITLLALLERLLRYHHGGDGLAPSRGTLP